MAQVPETIQNPGRPIEVQEFARAVARAINGDLSFGEPIDNVSGGSNGRKDNISGSWVVQTIALGDFGTAVTFTHNLNASINGVGSTMTNVIWFESWRTSNTPPTVMQLVFRHGDAVGADSIELRPTSPIPPAGGATVRVFFQVVPPC